MFLVFCFSFTYYLLVFESLSLHQRLNWRKRFGPHLGICFEGNFENEYMCDAQLEAGQALVADIVKRYPSIHVGKHKDYNITACPGTNFPFTYIANPVTGTPEDEINDDEDTPSQWALEAWDWAMKKGITDGTKPHDTVTREQAVTMLWREAR